MTEKPARRRRRVLLVPLLGMGVAAWAVRSRLAERRTLHDGWQPLPPRPAAPRAVPVPVADEAPAAPGPALAPVVDAAGPELVVPPAPTPEPAAAAVVADPAPVGAEPEPVGAEPEPVGVDAAPVAAEPAPVAAAAEPEPTAEPEPALARARAVPAATAVTSVTASALPDTPFGPGSVRAGADGASPDAAYVVKGKTATRVFYAPGSPYFARTRADVWFRTADDAHAAGFTPRAPRRPS